MTETVNPRVVVYRVPLCADCIRAECLLRQRGIHYQEVDVAEDDDRRYWLSEATGRHSLPQIFIDGEPIGGCSELLALDSGGKLALIAPATSRPSESVF